ncbi:MAG: hypothetical protein V7686_05605 [Qipengyuania sp.]|jgi:hypothetical protein
MTAPARFKQSDVKRAAAGVVAAGLSVARVEIDVNGKIVIYPGRPTIAPRNDNEWEDLEQ